MANLIGNYEIAEILGDGGMGTVYRGRDPRFDRAVAIKMLHPQFQRSQETLERFRTEAVIQAKLNHPNIVTVLDFVVSDQVLAIVMEYVEGRALDSIIESHQGPIDLERTIAIAGQVLLAIGFAHGQGVVHRDLKPSNIIVQDLGGTELAKVMDFGIAKVLGSEKLKTAAGAKMGTISYMSPEHVRSPRDVDRRADIYSLGVMLYEMVTGELPFDADTEFELMRRTVEDVPRPIESFKPDINPALADVIRKAMAKEPENRFQSCRDMLNALRSVDFKTSSIDASAARPNDKQTYRSTSGPKTPPVATEERNEAITDGVGTEPTSQRTSPRTLWIGAISIVMFMMVVLAGWYGLGPQRTETGETVATDQRLNPDEVPDAGPASPELVATDPVNEMTNRASPQDSDVAGAAEDPPAEPVNQPSEPASPRPPDVAQEPELLAKEEPIVGSISVHWNPNATVEIGGLGTKQTPCVFSSVDPGEYQIEVSHPDYGWVVRSIVVQSGRSTDVEDSFEDPGALAINSVPWAEILIDGRAMGRTPATLVLAPGRYEVVLRPKGNRDEETKEQVIIRSGEERPLTHRFH